MTAATWLLLSVALQTAFAGESHGTATATPGTAIDLGQRYPATLDYSDESPGYEWTCDGDDVWKLREFTYLVGDAFGVKVGPSQVVFGRYGTNVLWAALFPDEPGLVIKASHGEGEHIASIWLRFHPARVSELFPSAIVVGNGDPRLLSRARLLAEFKMSSSWHAGYGASIPVRNSVTIDLETTEGLRRFYSIDADGETAQYFDGFRERTFEELSTIDSSRALAVFDRVWECFDSQYPLFVVKPDIDWSKLRDEFRPRAGSASSTRELASVLAQMLAHLKDLHVDVQIASHSAPGFRRERPLNANWNAISELVGAVADTKHDLAWSRSADGIGYINIYKLASTSLPAVFDDVLGKMDDSKGLILDLRFNGGGSELLGEHIAGRFLDRPRVYRMSQYRSGPKHSDLGPKQERVCKPSGSWHYTGPVVVLQGQHTMSSAESFALMLAQCPQVTTMGDRPAGSRLHRGRLDAGAGIAVYLPQGLDLDTEGKPIDAMGVPPDVPVEAKPEDFTDQRDPVLERALAHLRGLTTEEKSNRDRVLQRRQTAEEKSEEQVANRPRVVSTVPADGATDVDLATEIRIRFDRPIDPLGATLVWDPLTGGGFRPSGTMQYLTETHEFVVPVRFIPGREHRVAFQSWPVESTAQGFRSADGVAAAPFSWRFRTRKLDRKQPVTKPQVVSITPPSEAGVAVYTPIRIQFDRPVVTDLAELIDKTWTAEGLPRASVPFPIEYDAAAQTLTVTALLSPGQAIALQLRGIRDLQGVECDPVAITYQVGKDLYTQDERTRIGAAARSKELQDLVEAVRRRSAQLRSVSETVHTTMFHGYQPTWFSRLDCSGARFWYDADGRICADVGHIMNIPFRVGCDGERAWFLMRDRIIACPSDEIGIKNIVISDPFGTKRYASAAEAIERLQLEYLGTTQFAGATCHRVRSWAGRVLQQSTVVGLRDWLIDTRTLLPRALDEYGNFHILRREFVYHEIDQPIDAQAFRPPDDPALLRQAPEPLGTDYDRRFLNACDGSDGRMSVRWGKLGPDGRRSSDGLN